MLDHLDRQQGTVGGEAPFRTAGPDSTPNLRLRMALSTVGLVWDGRLQVPRRPVKVDDEGVAGDIGHISSFIHPEIEDLQFSPSFDSFKWHRHVCLRMAMENRNSSSRQPTTTACVKKRLTALNVSCPLPHRSAAVPLCPAGSGCRRELHCPPPPQTGHQHHTDSGGNGHQGLIATGAGSQGGVSPFGQSIDLADGGVQVDVQEQVAGTGPNRICQGRFPG